MALGVVRAKIHVRQTGSDSGEGDRFEFPAEISNNLLDSYYTRMDPTSLRNFAADSKAGVGLLEGHRTSGMPFGRSFSGKLEEYESRQRVLSDFYMLRETRLKNVTYETTDELIRQIDAGIVSDVSVGFHDAFFRCDICNRDMWDWSGWPDDYCRHWPGRTYEIDDEKVLCTATIEGARLAEVSLVYSGATPEAKIERKAQYFYERGKLDEKAVFGLNSLYNLRMAPDDWEQNHNKRRVFDMAIMDTLRAAKIEGLPLEDEAGAVEWLIGQHTELSEKTGELQGEVDGHAEVVTKRDELVVENNQLREKSQLNEDLAGQAKTRREENERLTAENDGLKESNGKLTEARENDKVSLERLPKVEKERDELKTKVEERDTELTELKTDSEEKETLIELGKEARTELIKLAVDEGSRALGDDFDKEAKTAFLEKQNLATVREWKENWEAIAKKRFPGGRQSTDPDPDPDLEEFSEIPDSVYGIFDEK